MTKWLVSLAYALWVVVSVALGASALPTEDLSEFGGLPAIVFFVTAIGSLSGAIFVLARVGKAVHGWWVPFRVQGAGWPTVVAFVGIAALLCGPYLLSVWFFTQRSSSGA
jgi:hypothetical protein